MKPLISAALFLCLPAAAMAEIRLSGQAAMGLVHENGKTTAVSDLDLTLHASRVTDGGLEFGAVLDVTQSQSQSQSRAFRRDPPRAYVYMSTGNFTVRAGNTLPTAGLTNAPTRSALGF